MTSTIGRGLVAGAFGTMLLNAATYLDMALTGRPASGAPAETVKHSMTSLGLRPPRDDERLEAYAALGGLATGVTLGMVASLARSAGLRLPAPVGAVAIGGFAMAATDAPMARLGVSDPRDWSRSDWVRDVVPHLAYGAGVRWAMDRMDPPAPERVTVTTRPAKRSRLGLVGRSLALGLATGGRSTLALGGPVLAARSGTPAVVAAGLVGTELVADKVPSIPSRLEAGPLALRVLAGGAGAVALARRDDTGPVMPALAGMAGAVVGSIAGAAWREIGAERGWTWKAGAAEDGVCLGLTALACR